MPKRLFIALPLSAAAIDELRAEMGRLRPFAPPVKWVRPEQLHVTLKFLGDVAEEREEDVIDALRQAADISMFTFNMSGIGAFPDRRRPRVIWAGIEKGRNEVVQLAGRVEDKLAAVKFERGQMPFSPHVTLGRVRERGDFARMWQETERAPFVGCDDGAVEVKLIWSTLTPKGPIYKDLATFALQGVGG